MITARRELEGVPPLQGALSPPGATVGKGRARRGRDYGSKKAPVAAEPAEKPESPEDSFSESVSDHDLVGGAAEEDLR